MRTMQIGKLNKRVTLMRLADVTDVFGQNKKQLSDIATVWADFYPVRGSEFYEIQKLQSKVTHKCYIRYSETVADISSNDFISYENKTYSIESVSDVGLEHKMLEIYCSERTNKEGYIHEL